MAIYQSTKHTGVQYHDARDGTRTFYIRYRDAGGKLKREKVGSKAEGITAIYCKKLRDQILVKQRLGEDAPVKSRNTVITLKELSDQYFEDSEARSKSNLQSVYNTHLSHLDDMPIDAIDNDVLKALQRKKRKEVSSKTERTLSAKTVNNITTLLVAILNWGMNEKEYLKSTPKVKKIQLDNSRERFLTKDEINDLYIAIENSGLPTANRLLLFVKISLTTGARLGSVLSITGKDINLTSRSVSLKNHKTGKRYTGYLSTSVLALIPPLKPQERLIDVSDPKQIQRPLQGILDRLFNGDLNAEDRKDRVVIHTLRHTFASHLAINGTSIHKIMKLMDHSDIAMTMRYAKLLPDAGQDEVEDLYK